MDEDKIKEVTKQIFEDLSVLLDVKPNAELAKKLKITLTTNKRYVEGESSITVDKLVEIGRNADVEVTVHLKKLKKIK